VVTVADENPTDTPLPPAPTVTVIADSAEWRVLVANWAFRFFSLIHDPEMAKLIGKSIDPTMTDFWCVADFTNYLGKIGLSGGLGQVTRILSAMERAGLLLRAGWHLQIPIMGQQYVSQGFTSPQLEGNLWLSEVLGAELIIPSYNAVTVLLAGTDAEGHPGKHWGTGLMLDETHIVTNKHVVAKLTADGGQVGVHPSDIPAGAEWQSQPCVYRMHKTLDVAVIESRLPDGAPAFRRLPGMVFREPRWADEVFVFGYPRVPMTAEMAISVQRGQVVNLPRLSEYAVQHGEVVNPATETIPDRDKVFLFSAITRPGNSGGPIVAGDGRVIGLVVEDSAEAPSTESCPESAPFYRGIPSSEVIRALDDLELGGIIKTEREPKRLELKLTFPNGERRLVGDDDEAKHQ
jgi:S1-C subfamily serine protease